MKQRVPDPIDRIVWRPGADILTNGWNPNVVHGPELRLLELSILRQGWVQPILVSPADLLIDGFHRLRLALTSVPLRRIYGGEVPTAVIDVDEAHAKLLTVRINRAKGTHVAIRLSSLVKSVIDDGGLAPAEVAEELGATLAEVELLYQDDIFKSRKLDERPFSKAWYPAEVKNTR